MSARLSVGAGMALATLAMAIPAGAVAQDNGSAPATEAAVPAPTERPVIVLPPAAPSPTPAATPRPAATATPAASPRPKPTPAASPRPISTPKPAPAPTASPTAAAPAASVPPTAPQSPQPAPAATAGAPAAAPSAPDSAGNGGWLTGLAVLAGLAVAGLLAILWWRRRPFAEPAAAAPPPLHLPQTPPEPAPAQPKVREPAAFWTPAMPSSGPATAAAAPQVAEARPKLAMDIAVTRAGLNLLSAIVELEVAVRNEGDAPAAEIALIADLLSARAGLDKDLGMLFAAPARRPSVPAFALEPGERRSLRVIASLPREAIMSIEVGGRQAFFPVASIDLRYPLPSGGKGQTATAFALGVERENSEKLMPFWVDGPARMHEQIGMRPQSLSIET